jgi:peptidoglycan/LPS O-acetylase OafA/YrhL
MVRPVDRHGAGVIPRRRGEPATALGDQPTAPAVGRLPGIEGLRAVAATSVVLYHIWLYGSASGPADMGYLSRFAFPHLAAGVTLFF